jgi:hypothetical protein
MGNLRGMPVTTVQEILRAAADSISFITNKGLTWHKDVHLAHWTFMMGV